MGRSTSSTRVPGRATAARLAEAWGADAAAEFFASTCSLLLELGAIAYWTYRGVKSPALRHAVRHVPQCAIALGDDSLRIKKAEGRGPGIEGRVYRYEAGPGGLTLTAAPTLARVGEALRALRADLGLTQNDVAQLAGVTASAVSQAERGHRGLSLETLLELTDSLGLSIDDFLRGKARAGYRLARRHDPRDRGSGHPLGPCSTTSNPAIASTRSTSLRTGRPRRNGHPTASRW
jgi:transcriptional regulator with XRE-family HTH domain